MSKFKYLISAGHGGMIDGKYVTAPKKMHTFEDGFVFYEGVFNRLVAESVCKKLDIAGIDYMYLHKSEEDVPLEQKAITANIQEDKHGNTIVIDLHANASPKHVEGKARGFEIYTSKGQTPSDPIASKMFESYSKSFPDRTARRDDSDGDPDKEANFYILRQTKGRAILIESGFMDNREEAEWMMSKEGINEISQAIFDGIKTIENYIYEY